MLRVHSPGATPPTVLKHFAAYKVYMAFVRDQLGALVETNARHGSMTVLRARLPWRRGVPQCVLVNGADYTRQVLTDTETYQSGGLSMRGPKGAALNRMRRGLVGINGEKHRDQRRLVTPFFMPKGVRALHPKIADVVRSQLDTWPVGETVDIAPRISRISLLVSAQNLMAGEDVGEAVRLAERTAELLKAAFAKGVFLLPVNLPGTPYRRLLKNAEELENGLLAMYARRKPSDPDSQHLLDRLLSVHRAEPERVTREDLVSAVVVLFMASHDTVTQSVLWSLFLLSQHPRILGELLEELQGRCGNEPPSLEALGELPLLDAVTREALRLFPPIPWAPRRVRAETELGGVPLHPWDVVVLGHYVTHRDPEVFPDPDQFRPERWFGAALDTYAYVPFSAGPRTCIGKSLGTATINMILAMVLQRFRLTMAPHSRIDRRVLLILSSKYGMPMTINRQDKKFQAVPVDGNVHDMVDLSRSEASTYRSTIPMSAPRQPVRKRRRAA